MQISPPSSNSSSTLSEPPCCHLPLVDHPYSLLTERLVEERPTFLTRSLCCFGRSTARSLWQGPRPSVLPYMRGVGRHILFLGFLSVRIMPIYTQRSAPSLTGLGILRPSIWLSGRSSRWLIKLLWSVWTGSCNPSPAPSFLSGVRWWS